jgi:hypothetical protein
MKIEIDNSSEIFGSKTSIADLAQFSNAIKNFGSMDVDSDIFNIYVYERIVREYKFELTDSQIFECDRFVLTFKDGSKLTVIR